MESAGVTRPFRCQLLRGSITILLGLMVLSCGNVPEEDQPPEGIYEIEVVPKTDDCYISNGGTSIRGGHLASVRLIAKSPCKRVQGLRVEYLPGVESLWFFEGIATVKQRLSILANPSLKSLQGLDSLSRAEQIRIVSNSSLETLEGLENLEAIETSDDPLIIPLTDPGMLHIRYNQNLESLKGLENLKRANSVRITHNESLRSIKALYQLESLERLTVINSPVPRCQIDELISRLESEPEQLDIKGVGTGSCE